MPDTVDFFVHIPKTAGTTMLQIIEGHYGADKVLSFREIPREERIALVKAKGPEIRCVAGHLHYGEHRHFPRPCRPFTMLREPTERVISLYYFILREKTQPSHEKLKRGELTLDQIARRQGAAMARFIAGHRAKEGIPDADLLAEAKYVLEHTMATFGLTERFDESLLMFNRALGWNVRGYAKANVTKNRPTGEKMGSEQVALIRAYNAVDTELYSFAKNLFEHRLAKEPQPEFAEQLASLRRNVVVAQGLSRAREGWQKVREVLGLAR
jgi:hypothetical protein